MPRAAPLTYADCHALFDLPVAQAAIVLGVSRPTISKVLRAHGVARWPYRRLRAQGKVPEWRQRRELSLPALPLPPALPRRPRRRRGGGAAEARTDGGETVGTANVSEIVVKEEEQEGEEEEFLKRLLEEPLDLGQVGVTGDGTVMQDDCFFECGDIGVTLLANESSVGSRGEPARAVVGDGSWCRGGFCAGERLAFTFFPYDIEDGGAGNDDLTVEITALDSSLSVDACDKEK